MMINPKPFGWLLLILLFASCLSEQNPCAQYMDFHNDFNDEIYLSEYKDSPDRYLEKNEEPILYKNEKESYRFIRNGAHGAFTHIYRLEHEADQYILTVKKFKRLNYDKPLDTVVYNGIKEVSYWEWNKLKKMMKNSCFWITSFKPSMPYKGRLTEGSMLMIEGYDPQRKNIAKKDYHIVMRALVSDNRNLGLVYSYIESLFPDH